MEEIKMNDFQIELRALLKKYDLDKSIGMGYIFLSAWIVTFLKILPTISSKKLSEFLNSESQVDVSASGGESDVLHDVVECNAERKNITETNEEDVEGTLEKIIDCESNFFCANQHIDSIKNCEVQCIQCCVCDGIT